MSWPKPLTIKNYLVDANKNKINRSNSNTLAIIKT